MSVNFCELFTSERSIDQTHLVSLAFDLFLKCGVVGSVRSHYACLCCGCFGGCRVCCPGGGCCWWRCPGWPVGNAPAAGTFTGLSLMACSSSSFLRSLLTTPPFCMFSK